MYFIYIIYIYIYVTRSVHVSAIQVVFGYVYRLSFRLAAESQWTAEDTTPAAVRVTGARARG